MISRRIGILFIVILCSSPAMAQLLDEIGSLRGHDSFVVRSLALSNDARTLASGDFAGTVILWDVDSRQRIVRFRRNSPDPVNSLMFSCDGKTLAGGTEGRSIFVWDVDARRVSLEFKGYKPPEAFPFQFENPGNPHGHKSSIAGMAFFDGPTKLISAGHDKTIKLWDVAAKKLLQTFALPCEEVFSFHVLPRQLAAVGTEDEILIFNLTNGKVDSTIKLDGVPIRSITSLHDGKMLVFAFGKSICIWDLEKNDRIHTVDGLAGEVEAITCIPNSDSIAFVGVTVPLSILRLGTNRLVHQAEQSMGSAIAVSQSGSLIATTTNEGTIKLWSVKADGN